MDRSFKWLVIGFFLVLFLFATSNSLKMLQQKVDTKKSQESTEVASTETIDEETPPMSNRVYAELIADVETLQPGQEFRLGVKLTIPPGGHIYWRNPGSSGLPSGIEWSMPAGFEMGPLQWPNPHRFETPEIEDISFGYEDELILFAEVRVPETVTTEESPTFAAKVYWLLCEESGQCIPDDKSLEFSLSVAETARLSEDAAIIDGYAARTPVPVDETDAPLSVSFPNDRARLKVSLSDHWEIAPGALFFPDEEEAWNLIGGQIEDGSGTTSIIFKPITESFPVSGVLTLPVQKPGDGDTTVLYVRVVYDAQD